MVRARGVDAELATPTAPPTRPALVLILAHQTLGVQAAVAGAAAEQTAVRKLGPYLSWDNRAKCPQ